MKKRGKHIAALLLCAALLVPAAQAAEPGRTDIPAGAWYAEAVEYCRKNSLMIGYGDGRFGPEDSLSRAQLVQILYNQAGCPAVRGGFTGVAEDAWYYGALAWAVENGVIVSPGDGPFEPEEAVARQDLAVMLWRLAGEPEAPRESGYSDGEEIAAYARAAVDWVSGLGIMRGMPDGSFQPEGKATRAQAAAVFARSGAAGSLSVVSVLDAMSAPSGIAAMADGAILVTDTYHKRLWRVREDKDAALCGDPVDGGSGLLAKYFKRPWAVAEFLGGWAVSDMENDTVFVVQSQKAVASSGGQETGLTVSDVNMAFDRPTGLASDEDGNLYVSDTGRGAVRRITPKGVLSTVAGGLDEPMGLCWKDGVLYIAETGANRIVKLENGKVSTVAGSGEDGLVDGPADQAAFSGPQGVAAGEDGAVYVADTLNSAIRRVRSGQVETVTVRNAALTDFGLISPSGLLLQGNRLYICDGFARKLFLLELTSQ